MAEADRPRTLQLHLPVFWSREVEKRSFSKTSPRLLRRLVMRCTFPSSVTVTFRVTVTFSVIGFFAKDGIPTMHLQARFS